MKIKSLASKFDFTEDELIYAFVQLGYLKNNGEPKSQYIKNGMFTKKGEYNYKKEFVETFETDLPKIKEYVSMKQIEQLLEVINGLVETQESLKETIEEMSEKIDSIQEKLDEFEVDDEEETPAPKKERKKMSDKEKAEFMKSRARSLEGKTINGWKITCDKLDVVAEKFGHKTIRMSGMKKREDLEVLLK